MDGGERVIEEMAELASFAPAAQRYIGRSIAVSGLGQTPPFQWARDFSESAPISAQMGLYKLLPLIREHLPKSNAFWALSDFYGPALACAGFDVGQGRLEGFAPFRFLYERLLGARSRPWLPGLYASAVCLPSLQAEVRFDLLDELWEEARDTYYWSSIEPVFFPEWVPDAKCGD